MSAEFVIGTSVLNHRCGTTEGRQRKVLTTPACRWVVSLAVATSVAFAAHAQNPFIEAARANAPPPQAEPTAATKIVRVFIDGCVANEGESMKTVDWAINQGFEPDFARGGAAESLLQGQPGTVLAMPGSASPVLLAIDLDKRCTVWAERGDGPAVRSEFVKAMNALAAKGARLQPAQERTVERGGAWRMQLQMRYRRVGGSQDFGVGAVTTLATAPAAQALNLAPLPSRLDAPATDPTGLPVR
jgi:hypothetical protein